MYSPSVSLSGELWDGEGFAALQSYKMDISIRGQQCLAALKMSFQNTYEEALHTR